MTQDAAYGLFTHADGTKCIWLEETQEWFVPLDAGGEGYTCEKEHPRDEAQKELRRLWDVEFEHRGCRMLREKDNAYLLGVIEKLKKLP